MAIGIRIVSCHQFDDNRLGSHVPVGHLSAGGLPRTKRRTPRQPEPSQRGGMRALCVAVVVANSGLARTRVSTLEQMRLVYVNGRLVGEQE